MGRPYTDGNLRSGLNSGLWSSEEVITLDASHCRHFGQFFFITLLQFIDVLEHSFMHSFLKIPPRHLNGIGVWTLTWAPSGHQLDFLFLSHLDVALLVCLTHFSNVLHYVLINLKDIAPEFLWFVQMLFCKHMLCCHKFSCLLGAESSIQRRFSVYSRKLLAKKIAKNHLFYTSLLSGIEIFCNYIS